MKIEKYELNKKKNYYVYLSNGEVLELSSTVITENELLLKKEIDTTLYNKLIRDNTKDKLINTAIKYIRVRLRSIKEIKEYLKKKEEDIEIIDEVINKLISLGYLDDNNFTKAFIKDKINFTSWGDYKIKNELNSLGVSLSLIEDNLSKIDNKVFEDRIKKIIEKDINTNKKYSGLKLKNKIYNHLLTSGYSKDKVISIINNYNF